MIAKNISYNCVELKWRLHPEVKLYKLYRRSDQEDWEFIGDTENNFYFDNVPDNLNEHRYSYLLKKEGSEFFPSESVESSIHDWCESELPSLQLPAENKHWDDIYKKAWQLSWRGIRSSKALPEKYCYNDYPDCDITYLWDSCFCSLFQRYAAQKDIHPCMVTIDNFYAKMDSRGFIPRSYVCETFKSEYDEDCSPVAINPPLLAWAELNYYKISANKNRLIQKLPLLIKHFNFIEDFLHVGDGLYKWHAGGEGWDNINRGEGAQECVYYLDLLAQQALSAECISQIAKEIKKNDISLKFEKIYADLKNKMNSIYWNSEKSWFCSLTKEKDFVKKTINAMWPLMAGIADENKALESVKNTLLNPECFNTHPMPLPTLAKDERAYNPLGEYWRGGVWINMSLMVIRALERYGFYDEAFDFASRTIDGIFRTYSEFDEFPNSLWECYAPEVVGPASHKFISPDRIGGVREEFCGWTCCLISILIENILGFKVNAPKNELDWRINLNKDHGIKKLRFGSVNADIFIKINKLNKEAVIEIKTNADFNLNVIYQQKRYSFKVLKETFKYKLNPVGNHD